MASWRRLGLLAVAITTLTASLACGSAAKNDSNTNTSAAPTASSGSDAASKDTSGTGGTLTIGMSAGNIPIPNTPPDQGFEGRRFVGYQIYDGLANWNLAQGDTVPVPTPALAESWTTAEDKLTWTFKLRQGVKFHDGTPFNAQAVVFQFDRIMNKDFEFFDPDMYSSNRSYTINYDSYKALDEFTFQLKTRIPYAFLPVDMTYVNFPSPTVVRQYGVKGYSQHASGTGPFKMEKYIDGQVMELVPNKEYWGAKAKLDRIILKPMPEPATRLAALQSGEVQWAEVPPPDSRRQLEAGNFNVLLKQYPHAIRIDFNLGQKPFDDPKVREALQYAVDRVGMCTSLLNGLCAPSSQLMYKGHPWYDSEIGDKYTYNQAKAKQMLTEAGHGAGLKMTIAYPTSGSGNMWPNPMMELVQKNLKDVGVDATLVPLEWNTVITLYRAGLYAPENQKYSALFFSPSTNSAVALLNYSSTRIQPTGCCNVWGYKSADVDRLLSEAQSEFDVAKQDLLLRQAMGAMAKDSPSIFLVHDLNFRALSPKVRGFIQSQSWFADLTTVWMKN